MLIKVQTTIGTTKYEFNIDERSEMDALHKAAVLGNAPSYCPLCQKGTVRLESNKDKEGNTYVNVVCTSCYSKAKLGQYKTGGYFWHKFEKYVKPQADNAIPQPDPNDYKKGAPLNEYEEDVPF